MTDTERLKRIETAAKQWAEAHKPIAIHPVTPENLAAAREDAVIYTVLRMVLDGKGPE